jgi:NhaP-type Na+/H+ or K+/H+ antiporter
MLLWVFNYPILRHARANGVPDAGFHESLERLKDISGHLLLHVFLPPLLFADCISMDWHTARRTLGQTCLLAFPGVLMAAALQAVVCTFALPYHWDWMMSCTFGSMLAATDPVAVVAMLKSLGAPASVTAIVAGESLLNDGSSIVLYKIFFEVRMSCSLHIVGTALHAASRCRTSACVVFRSTRFRAGPTERQSRASTSSP